jgi:lipoprotein-anchoring transpeptidase ErfK/SrfK
VKRLHAVVLFVAGFAAAGVFSGAVIADVTTTTSTTTGVSTTVETTTTTATTTTVTTTPTRGGILPKGVRIAGVRVAGLPVAEAVSQVQDAFSKQLPVVVDGTTLLLDPKTVANAYAAIAVAKARIADPGSNVKLSVAVNGPALRAWIAAVQKRFARPAVDATLTFKNAKPVIKPAVPGRALNASTIRQRLIAALSSNSRLPVHFKTRAIQPTVPTGTYSSVIVINRSLNRLFLFDETKLVRTFKVATGQAIYPTPTGTFHIVVMQKDPWWYPPTQDAWAKGLKPVPPGPNNPLGTRWMGLDVPGVGIHGTDEPASIGYSESHGCIRMQVPDAEWLFLHVQVGTTVYIV